MEQIGPKDEGTRLTAVPEGLRVELPIWGARYYLACLW